MSRATHIQVRDLIDALPVFDLSDYPLQTWALVYPLLMPVEEVWFSIAEKIAKFAAANALTFFERPRIDIRSFVNDGTGHTENVKLVTALFKSRPLIAADMKFRNRKSAGELALDTPVQGNA